MVRKFLLVSALTLLISSCGFFGATAFPTAISEEYDWLSFSDIDDFYILDNGSLQLLVVVLNNTSMTTVAIFDTSLNLRGYMRDGENGILTDGIGFVDHNDDFVIGKTKISDVGTTEPSDISIVNVPNHHNNSAVISYTHTDSTNYYLEVLNDGNVNLYNDMWVQQGVVQPINNFADIKVLNQNNRHFSDIVFAKKSGDVFVYTKSDLYAHALAAFIDLTSPTFSLTNSNLSGFGTRCSRGYFVSTYSGEYVLYGNTGNEIDRVENDDDYNEVVTIDYDCEYYYYINKDRGFIVKERLPF